MTPWDFFSVLTSSRRSSTQAAPPRPVSKLASSSPEPKAYPFPGRAAVEALAPFETWPPDSPIQRDAHVARWILEGKLDPVDWIPIHVRGGLFVQVSGDGVKFGGVRLCCSQVAAQWVADALGALTPTAGITDAIWRAANIRLGPLPLDPNPGGNVRAWLREQDRIEAELVEARAWRAAHMAPRLEPDLVADVGKDYVLDARLLERPGQCAIYGWRSLAGVPIQSPATGASLLHRLSFYDYSHAVRVVKREAILHGARVDLAEIYRTRPELVTWPGYPAPPTRHPSVPLLPRLPPSV